MPELCTFPICTGGDTSHTAFKACRRCKPTPAPLSPEDRVTALKAELDATRRTLWMLVEQAGGRFEISRSVAQKFQSDKATLRTWEDPESGAFVYETGG